MSRREHDPLAGDRPFGLIELGSNSLKFYLVRPGADSGPPSISTHKFPWGIAHDYFRDGTIAESTAAEVIERIRGVESVAEELPVSSMIAVATGVFRELPEAARLAGRIQDEAGVRVRVISGADEARLMARDFQPEPHGDVLLVDLGGATTEWAWFRDGAIRTWGSLRLGAIRNEYRFRSLKQDGAQYLQRSGVEIDTELQALPFRHHAELVAIGGTAKAAARCAGTEAVSLEQLRDLMVATLQDGPPSKLKPSRQAVFLPGLAILWRIMLRARTPAFRYGKTAVRDGMAGRLVRLLGVYRRDQLHATLLLHSSQIGPAGDRSE